MRRLNIGALVALYLAAVVAANLIVNRYGPSSTPYVAFGLVGFTLIMRDRFTDLAGPRRIWPQFALICAGGILTLLIAAGAALIVEGSVIAFMVSELVEACVYVAIFRKPWMQRAPVSALAGALVDSVLFIWIAFGWDFPLAFRQWTAKAAGALVWALVVQAIKARREVLPRNA